MTEITPKTGEIYLEESTEDGFKWIAKPFKVTDKLVHSISIDLSYYGYIFDGFNRLSDTVYTPATDEQKIQLLTAMAEHGDATKEDLDLLSELTATDNVNHPQHYAGKVETIDYLQDKLTQEEFAGFCKGNVLKYVSRANLKNGREDLEKAKWYLDKMLEEENDR